MKTVWNYAPVRFVREVIQVYFNLHISRSAAELAYFLILTFFPVLICINAFIGSLHLEPNTVLNAAATFVPRESLGVLDDYLFYINTNRSPALLAAGISMTLFSASAAVRALMNIMDDIYGHGSYKGLWRVVASMTFSVLLLFVIYLSIVVVITGGWFFHLLEQRLGITDLAWDWQWMRFLFLFCLVLVFVLFIYRISAPHSKPTPPLLTGGVLASAALVAFSMLFSWFIGLSSRYSLVYGSLASVIILLVWLYLCGNILILGNVINAVWYRHKVDRFRKKK